ncbi:aminotransferase class I/II-fold pyridoxal phosphate-dependent enzyme [Bacillus sp. DTU_2020_1000418_1_SI_GHA_SEK_038]|uniref:aminotransferase class I/II-fold pyridoxal phosphate-dependent enzyme n=1 Tax=Bacillus sp. DTU_2020_1000418_1_SI_GHA_SEK_038 TaxID=3077585 RepID=UPI0028E539B2|nr:aminotransferase class I/II-fold pyridoxal phosphate-dependent enzyme [Bacillus sp. DTU_2020_1000418_1_SI_GHA_SEK_038]WNS75765.1 aminotransferase class I/II-fold pyridoxal phosphate-dependent enzyme [Bacillus sp. DTU_2020_1000418_1_SI_GHA_SEK_038]
MSLSINHKAKELEAPGIRKFANQLVNFPDAVNLTIGQPDFPTPEAIKNAGIRAIENNQTAYSHNAGLLELRQATASFFEDIYGFSYDPESEIIVTNGASEGIDSVFRTILEEGDEVIIPAPIYSGYEPIIELCGAKVVYLDTSDTGFLPSPERLKAMITPKTKAILLNYPSNPIGITLEPNLMDTLAGVLENEEIYILSDEIYSENTFGGKHHSFASYPQLRDRMFLIHGLSKSHSMTGWRIGFVLGPEKLMQHVLNVHLYNSICASLPSQYAGIEALTACRDVPAKMNIEYIKRRDFVYDRLTNMGLDVVKPNGAFYIFPSIKAFGMPSYEFATRLLYEGGVAVVPGSTFTEHGEGYIRISYAYAMPMLEKGMDRLEQFIVTLRKQNEKKVSI